MWSFARAAAAAAIGESKPATPFLMWMCADAPPSAATRNMRSISAIVAPGVYALPKPTATAPSASPFRRIASISAICASAAEPHPVVHDLAAATRRIPRRDVAGTDFQLEGGGHTVANHQRVRLLLLPVFVQVDETGGDDEASPVDHPRAGEGRGRDGLPAPGANAHGAGPP